MDSKLFARLTESMTQINEIIGGEREPSRETILAAEKVKGIRQATYDEKDNSFRTPD